MFFGGFYTTLKFLINEFENFLRIYLIFQILQFHYSSIHKHFWFVWKSFMGENFKINQRCQDVKSQDVKMSKGEEVKVSRVEFLMNLFFRIWRPKFVLVLFYNLATYIKVVGKNKHKFGHTICEVKYPLSFSFKKSCKLYIDLQFDLLKHSIYGTSSKSFP